ncbi:hypothetical protein MFLAVUS_004677 [Mucor flavus]|uniref:Uncharacterized protein n=1 Tax=Mucor flavus TaxID=439312 RepID=A0ABP9YWK9_9FUNG
MAYSSPLIDSSLPAYRHIFPVKRIQVSVEEFIPCSNTNKDANMDTKEEMKKEIEKHADLITFTPPPPPFPFPSQQLTFKGHFLKHSTAQKEKSRGKGAS